MKTRHYQLAVTLASAVDKLLFILHKYISTTEYHKIFSTHNNPIIRMRLLLDAICAHNDTEMYARFCDAVKIIKFDELSRELRSFLD